MSNACLALDIVLSAVAVSSVGARHAVPERASIVVAQTSTFKPTRSVVSSHRVLTHPATWGTGRNEIANTSNGKTAPSSFAGHGMPCPY
ncbi:MAG: hypothetical protein WCC03_12565 [Candidatus Acidiferrales bacterium]